MIRPEDVGARPHPQRRHPGSPTKTAARVTQVHPEAAFYLMFMISQAALLPLSVAKTEEDRPAVESYLAHELGLEEARQDGIISGYVIRWPKTPYPQTVKSVLLIQPQGKTHWRKLLGDRLYDNLHRFLCSIQNPENSHFPSKEKPRV